MLRTISRYARLLTAVAVGCALSVGTLGGQMGGVNGEWRAYGGDTGHTRYAPLNQIDASNFSKLVVAWRFKTDHLGPRPEFMFEVDAGDGQRRVVYDSRKPARGRGARSRDGRGAVDAQRTRRPARRGSATTAFGPRPRVLDRRKRGTHPLRHARLSARCAQRENRHARAGVRRRRHRRSEAEQRSGDRSDVGRDRPALHADGGRQRRRRRRRAPIGRRSDRQDEHQGLHPRVRRAGPASGCGSSTRFRRQENSATRRG